MRTYSQLVGRLSLGLVSVFVLMGADQCQAPPSQQRAVVGEMIQAFKGACNMGPWTQAALGRSSDLISAYRALQAKVSCSNNPNVLKAIGASEALYSELQRLQTAQSLGDERKWEELSNDLLIQIDQTTDATIKANLIAQYSTARYNLSEARANSNYLQNQSYKEKMIYAFEGINARLRDVLAASNGLTDCYNANPAIAMQVGTSLAELGGAFAPSLLGQLALSTIATLVKTSVDFAVKAPSVHAIWDLSQGQMPAALTCGLEALTRDYCKARDASVLASFPERGRNAQTKEFFYGTELQDRYMPKLYGWLDKVVNGSGEIGNSQQAAQIKLQYDRLNGAKSQLIDVQGKFGDAKARLARDPSREQDILVSLLKSVVATLFQNNNGFGREATDTSIFGGLLNGDGFILRVVAQPSFNCSNGAPCNSLEDRIGTLHFGAGDIFNVQARFNAVFQEYFNLAQQEFNDKVQINPSLTMIGASDIDFEGLSPLVAWERMEKFLGQFSMPPDPAGQQRYQILIEEFRAQLDPIHAKVADPRAVSGRCPPVTPIPGQPQPPCIPPAVETLTDVYNAFKLDRNNVFLPGMVANFVKQDIIHRACKGQTPKDIKDLMRIGGQDLSLLMNRSGISTTSVNSDLATAKSVTQATLRQFKGFFRGGILRAMKELRDAAEANHEPPAGDHRAANREVLSKLCILTYISGNDADWTSDLHQYCADAKILGTDNFPITLDGLRRSLGGNTPLDSRLCAYEKFLRLDRIKANRIEENKCASRQPQPAPAASPFASVRHVFGFQEPQASDTPDRDEFFQRALYSN